MSKLKTPLDQDAARGDQGTYNPRSAWMLVDSRRRVLPDIDGNTYNPSNLFYGPCNTYLYIV